MTSVWSKEKSFSTLTAKASSIGRRAMLAGDIALQEAEDPDQNEFLDKDSQKSIPNCTTLTRKLIEDSRKIKANV